MVSTVQPDPIPEVHVQQAQQEDQPLELGQPVKTDPVLPVVQAVPLIPVWPTFYTYG